jgi:hypothetical protein
LREFSVRAFCEHSRAGGAPHQPVQQPGLHSQLAGQFLSRLWTGFDQIRNAEPRHARNGTGSPGRYQHLEHGAVGGRSLELWIHLFNLT